MMGLNVMNASLVRPQCMPSRTRKPRYASTAPATAAPPLAHCSLSSAPTSAAASQPVTLPLVLQRSLLLLKCLGPNGCCDVDAGVMQACSSWCRLVLTEGCGAAPSPGVGQRSGSRCDPPAVAMEGEGATGEGHVVVAVGMQVVAGLGGVPAGVVWLGVARTIMHVSSPASRGRPSSSDGKTSTGAGSCLLPAPPCRSDEPLLPPGPVAVIKDLNVFAAGAMTLACRCGTAQTSAPDACCSTSAGQASVMRSRCTSALNSMADRASRKQMMNESPSHTLS